MNRPGAARRGAWRHFQRASLNVAGLTVVGLALVGLTGLGLVSCHRQTGDITTRGLSGAAADRGDDLPRDGSLSVSLRAVLVSGKSERPLAEGETLHSGDHLYFQLRTSQPAYLYVVLFGPDGSASVLYPPAGPGGVVDETRARIAARCPVRIPDRDSFYLQDPAGLQDLRVVAASEPLPRSDRRLCEVLRLPCQSVADLPVPPCPPERSRGLFSAVKVAAASPAGVASLRLLLKQEK